MSCTNSFSAEVEYAWAVRPLLLLAIVLTLCGIAPARAQSGVAPATDTMAASPGLSSHPGVIGKRASVTAADRDFMVELATAMRGQVDASLLAVLKSKNPAFQRFAREMVEANEARLDRLNKLAKAKDVGLPSNASELHRKRMRLFRDMGSAQFQREYARAYGVQNLRWMRRLARIALERARDPEVRAVAADLLPEMNKDIQRGQALVKTAGRRQSLRDAGR